ncbi:unnamed protein product, partial [Owenia fusiformis]
NNMLLLLVLIFLLQFIWKKICCHRRHHHRPRILHHLHQSSNGIRPVVPVAFVLRLFCLILFYYYCTKYLLYIFVAWILCALILKVLPVIPHIAKLWLDFKNGYKPVSFSLSLDEDYRLSEWIKDFFNKSNFKERYSENELEEHEAFVMGFVKRLCDKLGKLYPAFKVKIVPSGSYYDRTKVIEPDEFDYKLVFTNVQGFKTHRTVFSSNMKKLFMNDEQFLRTINDSKHPLFKKSRMDTLHSFLTFLQHILIDFPLFIVAIPVEVFVLTFICVCIWRVFIKKFFNHMETIDVLCAVLDAVNVCIRRSKELSCDLIYVARKAVIHGPCVSLAIKAPLCDTLIDLGFCFKQPHSQTVDASYLVLPTPYEDWTLTRLSLNSIDTMSLNHKMIFMVLKCIAKRTPTLMI